MPEPNLALQVVSLAAKLLLRSGAEIYRVQETVERILEHAGFQEHDVYVLANGFFINVNLDGRSNSTAIRYVPIQGIDLGIIGKVNQVSRSVCDGSCTLEAALEELREIENPSLGVREVRRKKLLACCLSGIGSATFCYMFGGGWVDFLLCLPLGFLLQVVLYASKRTSRYLSYVFGSFTVTLLAAWMAAALPVVSFDHLVIGGIFPLVPGVVFTTSINEIFDGDHLSGSIHLLDAVMTGVCMAIGVCAAITVQRMIGG